MLKELEHMDIEVIAQHVAERLMMLLNGKTPASESYEACDVKALATCLMLNPRWVHGHTGSMYLEWNHYESV